MPVMTVTTRDGESRQVEGKVGRSVMETLRDAGFDELVAMCGGACSCATCHVYVDDETLARITPAAGAENDLLDSSEYRQANSRLSCQLRISEQMDGISLTIAPED